MNNVEDIDKILSLPYKGKCQSKDGGRQCRHGGRFVVAEKEAEVEVKSAG